MCAQITIDPNGYTGTYDLLSLSSGMIEEGIPGTAGPRSFSLAPDKYNARVSPGANFVFRVTDIGTVVNESPGLACANQTVTFRTTTIHVNPESYKGTYWIAGVDDVPKDRASPFVVLRALVHNESDGGYALHFAPGNAMRFSVTENGDVAENTSYTGAADYRGPRLHLNKKEVLIEPNAYTGPWLVRGVEAAAQEGSRRVGVVPHVNGYILEIRPGANSRFNVAEDGTPSTPVIVPEGANSWEFKLSKWPRP